MAKKPDEMYYSSDEIMQLIRLPKKLGRRGIYSVEKLRAYTCQVFKATLVLVLKELL